MANTADGSPATLIQLKRGTTSGAYSGSASLSEGLSYGEPLYVERKENNLTVDQYLLIGSENNTVPQRVFESIPLNRAELQSFVAKTNNEDYGQIAQMMNINANVFPLSKHWDRVSVTATTTTYNFTATDDNDPNRGYTQGSAQSTPFSSFPCSTQHNITGMRKEYIPVVSYLPTANQLTNVANLNKIKNAFACISSVLTDDGKIIIIWNDNPGTYLGGTNWSFSLNLEGA